MKITFDIYHVSANMGISKQTEDFMKTASWAIINLKTGNAIYETFNPRFVAALNTEKYKAIPIRQWLASLSRKEAV